MSKTGGWRVLPVLLVVLAALALPLSLALWGGWDMWRSARAPANAPAEPAPALRGVVEAVADQALPAPVIEQVALQVRAAPGEGRAEMDRIVRLAGGLGGEATGIPQDGGFRLIAKVPSAALPMFRTAVETGIRDIAAGQAVGPLETVEIVVREEPRE